MARTETLTVPEVGGEAPEFNLPSAQGGQLRLSMRTARGPVILVFYDGRSEEDARYFEALAGKEDEINMAGGTIVGIGVTEPDEAREFVRKTGLKSYVLYDYARAATRDYGLLEGDRKRGEHARAAAFVVDGDHKIAHAWVGERPSPDDLLAKISEITGLPKPTEEAEEAEGDGEKPAAKTPKKAPEGAEEAGGEGAGAEKPKKMTAEERERIKAERRAARAAGKSLKEPAAPSGGAREGEAAGAAGSGTEGPKKMTAEERERIKAERRAARAEGRSLKQPANPSGDGNEGGGDAPAGERKRLSPEEREKRRAERRAAREAEGAEAAKKPDAGGEAKDGPKGEAGEAGGEA